MNERYVLEKANEIKKNIKEALDELYVSEDIGEKGYQQIYSNYLANRNETENEETQWINATKEYIVKNLGTEYYLKKIEKMAYVAMRLGIYESEVNGATEKAITRSMMAKVVNDILDSEELYHSSASAREKIITIATNEMRYDEPWETTARNAIESYFGRK